MKPIAEAVAQTIINTIRINEINKMSKQKLAQEKGALKHKGSAAEAAAAAAVATAAEAAKLAAQLQRSLKPKISDKFFVPEEQDSMAGGEVPKPKDDVEEEDDDDQNFEIIDDDVNINKY